MSSFDPKRIPNWPPDWPEIRLAVQSCLSQGDWGRYHSQTNVDLQHRLQERCKRSHVRLCCSGTAAVEIALRAAGVSTGDEVLVAALDFPGNFRCIEAVGARPVLVDVQPGSACMSVADVQRIAAEYDRSPDTAATAPSDATAPTAATAASGTGVVAVIASSLFGHAADLVSLQTICRDRGWTLINDACQVMGMKVHGQPIESLGDVATASFGGSKVVTAGAGGAIFTHSDRIARRMDAWTDRPGQAFPISPLQAAAIGPQLDRLDEMHAIRNETVAFLCSELGRSLPSLIPRPSPDGHVQPAYYKLAFETPTAQSAARMVDRADQIGLPLGPAFRSMHRSSQRRCRKPVSLERSAKIAERWLLLDQRALLMAPKHREMLIGALHAVAKSA
jgi:dTDP-4-amino-4,6-dideoxygalactose transaminase